MDWTHQLRHLFKKKKKKKKKKNGAKCIHIINSTLKANEDDWGVLFLFLLRNEATFLRRDWYMLGFPL